VRLSGEIVQGPELRHLCPFCWRLETAVPVPQAVALGIPKDSIHDAANVVASCRQLPMSPRTRIAVGRRAPASWSGET